MKLASQKDFVSGLLFTVVGLAFAIGVYLPLATMAPLYVGGCVRALVERKRVLGLRGVPYFIFDRKVAIHGAREVVAFEQALLS